MIQPPTYEDGFFALYKVINDTSSDYPIEKLQDMEMEIWYRELSVFDRTKYEFDQGGVEITMKIKIPVYKVITSKHVLKINGELHRVYNAAHVKDKNGFWETELTLVRPEKELEIQ